MIVQWTVRHGYADDYQWIQTGEDTSETGEVVGYVTGDCIRAVIRTGNHLVSKPIDELTVVEQA